jgi:altronate dehydratase
VSLWRNWRQTDTSRLDALKARTAPDGVPLNVGLGLGAGLSSSLATLELFRSGDKFATERVGLVLPTSLCSTQIARLAVERLNAKQIGRTAGLSRFVTFTHTEGCGFGGQTMYELLQRTYRGYLRHPNIVAALLLEHGCEKVPNDIMRRQLDLAGMPLEQFGWASVQLDGGIEKALAKIEQWFAEKLAALPPVQTALVDLGALTVALLTAADVDPTTASTFARVAHTIISAGGTVLIAETDPLLANRDFLAPLLGDASPHATLAYGEPATQPGLHIVASETDHWVENLTGFGGCGAHLALTLVHGHAQQGHPLFPVLQAAEASQRGAVPADDIDVFLSGNIESNYNTLLRLITATAQREYTPVANAQGFVDFQLTRGELGLTT